MPDHRDYQSAMDKIVPSEAWKAATLEKLAAARAEQQKPKAAPRLRVAKRVGIPLAAAAAVALLAVPAALQSGQLSTAGAARSSAASEPAVAEYSLDAAPETGNTTQDVLRDEIQQKSAAPPVRDFDLGENGGLPVLVLGDDSGGMGGGVTYVAESLDDIRGSNPTWNIAAEDLPATLPVWHAQSGAYAGPLTGLLDRTADALGLSLLLEETEEAPLGYPSPDLWPASVFGGLMDPEHWEPNRPLYEQLDPSKAKVWSVSASGCTVAGYRDGEGESDDPLAGDDAALALLAEAAGIENPAHQYAVSTSYDGQTQWMPGEHFYYENSGDTVAQRLLNYTFRRVAGSTDSTGALRNFSLTLPPESAQVGDYPLRTVGEAKAALQTVLDEEQASGMRDYDLSVEQVAGWQLEYAQSSMNPYIQPVYRFWLKTSLTPEEAHYENVAGDVYVSYTVSALPEGYCIPFEEVFN